MRRLFPTGLQWEAKLLKLGKSFLSKITNPTHCPTKLQNTLDSSKAVFKFMLCGRKLKITVE